MLVCHRMNATNLLTLHLVFPSLLASLIGVPVFGAELNTHEPATRSVETVNVVQASVFPRVLTNTIAVELRQTNLITRYQTNLLTRYQTNLVAAYQTNLNTVTLTNLVTRHRTNVNTLTLTNWQTVLVFKTNWITQPVANLVQIDLPADQAAIPTAAAPTGGPILEAKRTAKPSVNGQAEISLKLKSVGNETPTFLSQEWQVERSDRSVLLFRRGPEFRREVPLGTYKVEVKTRSTEDSPFVRVR